MLTLIHDWFDQSLIVGWDRLFVEPAAPRKVKLSFVDVTPPVPYNSVHGVYLGPALYKRQHVGPDLH